MNTVKHRRILQYFIVTWQGGYHFDREQGVDQEIFLTGYFKNVAHHG